MLVVIWITAARPWVKFVQMVAREGQRDVIAMSKTT